MLGLLAGAGVGLGLCLVVGGWWPPRPGLAEAVAAWDAHRDRARRPEPVGSAGPDGGWAARLGAPAARLLADRAWVLPAGLAADLALTGRSLQRQAAEKAVGAAAGALLPAVAAGLLAAGGVGVPAGLWAAATLLVAAAGFLAPDAAVAGQARRLRQQMRHGLSAFLDLTVVSLAAGCGVEQALAHAAGTGDGPVFTRLRQALSAAEATRTSPWAALAELGEQVGLPELRELAASLALAGTEGARVRGSLAAKAATLRGRLLADTEAAAQAASERMSLPVVALFAGFLIFIGYPALATVLGL
jgi:Flp pilus assembly protein TadB